MVFSRIGGPLLTLFAIGWGVGALVDRGPSRGLPWQGQLLPYVVFVVPGILASQAMLTGFGESSWPVLAGIKWAGTYLAMLATPLRTRDILRGHVAQVGWQLAAGAALFVALAAPFGVLRSWWVLGPCRSRCSPVSGSRSRWRRSRHTHRAKPGSPSCSG
jgi:lipooligosaccharide transport system permease protein